jgi:hypothetical protein
MAKDKELEVKQQTPPAKIEPPKRGFEETTDKEDLILPRATLLQALSPQVIDGVEGCRPGIIINNITQEVLPEVFVPIFKWTEYLRFNPRDNKADNYDPAFEPGALIWKTVAPTPEQIAECQFGEAGEKPVAMKSMNFLCYFVGVEMPIVLSFAKTSYKAGKKLISLAQFSGSDMFSRKYKLMSKHAESNGNKYFVLEVGIVSKTNKEEFAIAENWFESFRGKDIKVHDEGLATGEAAE